MPFTEELFADLDEDDVDLYQGCLCPEYLRVNVYFTLLTLVLFVSEEAIAHGSPQQVSEIVETLTRLSKEHSGVGQVPVAGIFFLCSNAWTAYVGRESMQAMREAEEAGLAVANERATELTAAIHRIIRFVSPGHVLNDFLGAIDAGDESLRLWNVVGEKVQELGLRGPLQELEDSIELELGRLHAEHKEWAERVFGDRPRQISVWPTSRHSSKRTWSSPSPEFVQTHVMNLKGRNPVIYGTGVALPGYF